MSDILFDLLKNNQYLINILSKNEEILKKHYEFLFKNYKLQKEYLDSLKNENVNIEDETFKFKLKFAHLSSYIIKYIIEQITKIYLYNTVITKILDSSSSNSNVTFEQLNGGKKRRNQKGGKSILYYVRLLFVLLIFDSLITANDIIPHEYSPINLLVDINEGNIPEAKPTILDILDPNDNEEMLKMAENYYQAFRRKTKIPNLTQIIVSANLTDIFGSQYATDHKGSFMDIFLGTPKQTFLEFVKQEVPKINLIVKEYNEKLLKACDSFITISSHELPGELPLAFFKTLNKELQEELDNMLNEKTEIIERMEESLKKEKTEMAVSEFGELSQPTYYDSFLEQIQISFYPKSSTDVTTVNKVPPKESAEILENIENSVKEDINSISQDIDKTIFSKKYKKIMEKLSLDQEKFTFETNEKIYLSAICRNAFSNPPLFKFNATTGQLFLKDRPQSRFHIDIIVQNIMYNAPKLLDTVRDQDKRQHIESINEKAQVMFRLINEFNNNIKKILLEENTDETIEDYSNKLQTFFKNQRNRAEDAIKSNPILEERQKIAMIKLIEDAKLQSEKIQSESDASEIIAKADIESRKLSLNRSQEEWDIFGKETQLVSNGIFNFTSTFTSPIFNGFNFVINNFITNGYNVIIFILCFGATIGIWKSGVFNAIFNNIKRKLERDTQPQREVREEPQREVREVREDRVGNQEMSEEESRHFREWQQELREEDRRREATRIREEQQPRRIGRRRGGTMKFKKISKTKKYKRNTRNITKKNKKLNKKNKRRTKKKI